MRRVAGFEIVEELGRGGMGAVYRAREESTGREVALKVLLAAKGAGEAQRRRFAREGEVVASLRHPGIVGVHSAGEFEGVPYLAFELVTGGRNFDKVWPELVLVERVELLRDAAKALAYAHERGVVHRDVKPDNLLIDGSGTIRLADFGVAAASGLDRITATGALVGTPTYMAPEQIAGLATGPQADVWALGVVLYQLLTDTLPFDGPSLVALAAAIASVDPTPPCQLNPSVPRSMHTICLRALQRDPLDRYANAGDLARDLDLALGARDVSTRSGWRARDAKSLRRGLLLLTPAAISLAVFAWVFAREAPKSPPVTGGATPRASPSRDTPPQVAATSNAEPPATPSPWGAPPPLGQAYPGEGMGFSMARQAALAGSLDALSDVGNLLLDGVGVDPNPKAGLHWLRLAAKGGSGKAMEKLGMVLLADRPQEAWTFTLAAAKAGHPAAMYRVGATLVEGRNGVTADPPRGLRWLERAIEHESLISIVFLAGLLDKGSRAIPQDRVRARSLYLSAAARGDSNAMYCLGLMLKNGTGGLKDLSGARMWLARAVEAGSVAGRLPLGDMLVQGVGGPADRAKGIEHLTVVAKTGDAYSAYRLGQVYAQGENLAQAKVWWERAAPTVHDAAIELGRLLLAGPEADHPRGLKLLEGAAQEGSIGACRFLGVRFREHDPAAARRWYALGAGNNDPECAVALAELLLIGRGGERDPERARALLQGASESGHGWATTHLADILRLGELLPKDLRAARGLYKAAVKLGHPKTAYALMLLDGSGGPADPQLAVQLLERLGERGEGWAWLMLGEAYLKGRGLKRDVTQARRAYERARATDVKDHAERRLAALDLALGGKAAPAALGALRKRSEAGDGAASGRLGQAYLKGEGALQDLRAARTWFAKGSAQGDAWSSFFLGQMLAAGQGGPKDLSRSLAQMQLAAKRGVDSANATIGRCFERGEGVARDLAQARQAYARGSASGDAQSEIRLAELLLDGRGGPADPRRAESLLRRASASDAGAHFVLGEAFRKGRGIAKDPVKARACLEAALLAGEPRTPAALGQMLVRGLGGPRQGVRGVALLKQAGSGHALFQAAEALEMGRGVAKDLSQARACYEAAIELGDLNAMVCLARSLLRAEPKDAQRGEALYRRAASRGHATAPEWLGRAFRRGEGLPKSLSKARACFEQGVKVGNQLAMICLAEMLLDAEGGPPDPKRAVALMERTRGGVRSMADERLGHAFRDGRGVAQDHATARRYYRAAVAADNWNALVGLAELLLAGKGGPPDAPGAVRLLERASELGSAHAMLRLGGLFKYGKRVPRDLERARRLFRAAAAKGLKPAQRELESLKR
jgi:TPR repeat protein/serine/threonine protein kinase